MKVKIQRASDGAVLGAVLWVPASVFEKSIESGQEEIEVSFEGNQIIIEKEEATGAMGRAPAAEVHSDVRVPG